MVTQCPRYCSDWVDLGRCDAYEVLEIDEVDADNDEWERSSRRNELEDGCLAAADAAGKLDGPIIVGPPDSYSGGGGSTNVNVCNIAFN